jgi:hypothetical protein
MKVVINFISILKDNAYRCNTYQQMFYNFSLQIIFSFNHIQNIMILLIFIFSFSQLFVYLLNLNQNL